MKLEKIPELTTITEASRFTGMDPKTIRKRIQKLEILHVEGRNQFYSTLDVLRNVFIKATDEEKSELNLTQEKARYYRNLASKVEIECERLSDRLLDADQVLIDLSKSRLAVREKLMNLAYTLAGRIPKIKDKQKAFNLLQSKFAEVLEELSGDESVVNAPEDKG